MKCSRCGAEMRNTREEHCKDASGNPMYMDYSVCGQCGNKVQISKNAYKFDGNYQGQNFEFNNQYYGTQNGNTGKMYDKFYLNTWFIAICFAFSFLLIPFILGIIFLSLQMSENNKIAKRFGDEESCQMQINSMNARISGLNRQKIELEEQIKIEKNKLEDAKKELSNIKDESVSDDVMRIADSLDYSSYELLESSEECKNKMELLQIEEKELVNNGGALMIQSNGDTREAKKQIGDNSKQILRCFNAECTNAFSSLSANNIETVRNKVLKSFDSLNKIFKVDGVQLSKDMLEYKLKEVTLLNLYEKKRKEEKELQREIREQMKEEEKVRRELERKKSQIDKDQAQFNNEVAKLMKYMQSTENDIEKQLYSDKIKELEEKIRQLEEEKKDVENREQNARAGFVYIISNIGSFGDDVYKIGMTRRLEPMDRVKELGSASVPFEFDVHAMIFSEDAPSLENSLHHNFEKYRVNKINPRKEFFKVSLDEIETYVKENYNNTVEFTKVPVAKEYRDTLELVEY